MNTIEQAQEVAERLRNHDTCISDKKAANTIDALIAELCDERLRCAQADNAVAQLSAELAALKGQEPVAWSVTVGEKHHNCIAITYCKDDAVAEYAACTKGGFESIYTLHKLYRAAGAQPVQQEPITSSEKTWCQYVAGMIGTYLGEPVESERCKAIAGIIERRLWALGGVAPVKNQEPDDLTIAYMSGFYEGKKAAAPVQAGAQPAQEIDQIPKQGTTPNPMNEADAALWLKKNRQAPQEPTPAMLEAVRPEMSWCDPVGIFKKMMQAGAQPVPDVTKDSIRAAGGIVHSDGNVFFTNINQIKAMLATAPVQAGAEPAQDGFALLPKSVIEMTLNCLNTPERADLRLVLSDLHKALWATQAQEQERKPLGKDWIEERAHRRCRRYIGIDTEAPYQFNAHTLMDLVRDIEAKIKDQP